MPLTSGTRLGVYEIVGLIGAGGMGEVYRAHDTRLNRDVAIKILPELFAADADRVARFQREAQVLASLNHPNIAQIHGLEDTGDAKALVLELVEGPTLADLIAKGPIPIDEALPIAKQVAEALEAAHEHGIIHRDLKPANIKLTHDGSVKVLDFGLAKALASDPSNTNVSQSPTITSPAMTMRGVILGTAAYMSPEQAKGKPVDKRTDIWAFGCVLFEMLTGKRAFGGEEITATLARVIERDPDFTALPSSTTVAVRRLLYRCLEKDPRRRLRDIGEARIDLEASHSGETKWSQRDVVDRTEPVTRRVLQYVIAGLIGAVLAGALAWTLTPTAAPPTPLVRTTLSLPPDAEVFVGSPGVALSPDGMHLAYADIGPLVVRAMGDADAKPVLGTEVALAPFFSPDGQWIGFFERNKLKKVATRGGPILEICDAPGPWAGASWGADGTIYFSTFITRGIWKVGADGGTPQAVTMPDRGRGELAHAWPQVVPEGNALVFTVRRGMGWDEGDVHILSLQTGDRRLLVQGGHLGRYVASGHLLYSRLGGRSLMAVPFDRERMEVAGSPVALPAHVSDYDDGPTYAVSDTGLLAYVPGNPSRYQRRLVWIDRKGAIAPLAAPARPYSALRISPDGRYAAVQILGSTHRVWIYEFSRNTLTPLTPNGVTSQVPMWTVDGSRVAYRGTRQGLWGMLWMAADGSGGEAPLLSPSEALRNAWSWTPDGRWLAFQEINRAGSDIWLLSREGEVKPFLETPSWEWGPQFSPDGRWLAYSNNVSGRFEIYVQRFPGTGARLQISSDGGTLPTWSGDGRELFYIKGRQVMAARINTEPDLRASPAQFLFEHNAPTDPGGAFPYDVSGDGQRFLTIQAVEPDPERVQIHVVVNWLEELKRLVPVN